MGVASQVAAMLPALEGNTGGHGPTTRVDGLVADGAGEGSSFVGVEGDVFNLIIPGVPLAAITDQSLFVLLASLVRELRETRVLGGCGVCGVFVTGANVAFVDGVHDVLAANGGSPDACGAAFNISRRPPYT